ncbi:hypothetical protein BSKO_03473 [Bryopsis sp. KO-2023]|nr:hypothetical protein BSKO_03473 [Bryopsis sp. KO-2023]
MFNVRFGATVVSLVRGLHGAAKRSSRYTKVMDSDLDFFKRVVGSARVLTHPEDLVKFNRDWLGKHEGRSKVAVLPGSTEEISEILKYCNNRRLAVTPQGGNTGLVKGSIPIFDEIVLCTSRMNRVLKFDQDSGVLVCQAGCVLEELEHYTSKKGFTMPLDLGAKGSCQIGGNVSTNAGGVRLLRYGSLHGTVLGLEVVLANGEVLDLLQTLRKDNTGYDLKQLFIGSEGTLGVVSGVSILCPPLPTSTNVCFLACPDFPSVVKTFTLAKRKLGEILSATEFLDRESLFMSLTHLSNVRNPLPEENRPFYVLIETSGSEEQHDKEKLDRFLEAVVSEGAAVSGTVAQDSAQLKNMWRVREGVTEALNKRGAVYKYDLSLPVTEMYALVEEMREKLVGEDLIVVGYGHLGDGNLHLNVSSLDKSHNKGILKQIEPFVYEWTSMRRGSISAEHGLGHMKAECIRYSKSLTAVKTMGLLKRMFDPNLILNPYKVLPQSELGGAV